MLQLWTKEKEMKLIGLLASIVILGANIAMYLNWHYGLSFVIVIYLTITTTIAIVSMKE